jgi:hypothetical protein
VSSAWGDTNTLVGADTGGRLAGTGGRERDREGRTIPRAVFPLRTDGLARTDGGGNDSGQASTSASAALDPSGTGVAWALPPALPVPFLGSAPERAEMGMGPVAADVLRGGYDLRLIDRYLALVTAGEPEPGPEPVSAFGSGMPTGSIEALRGTTRGTGGEHANLSRLCLDPRALALQVTT